MFRRWKGTVLGLCLMFGFSAGISAREKAPTCDGDFGTSLKFEDSPQDASKIAKKEGKLVFVLHVSGHFEDPRFT